MFKNIKIGSRGEIATTLTLISLAVMVLGTLVGTKLVELGPKLNSKAAGNYGLISVAVCKVPDKDTLCSGNATDYISGLKISLRLQDGTINSNPTEQNGYYSFDNLPLGTHTAQIDTDDLNSKGYQLVSPSSYSLTLDKDVKAGGDIPFLTGLGALIGQNWTKKDAEVVSYNSARFNVVSSTGTTGGNNPNGACEKTACNTLFSEPPFNNNKEIWVYKGNPNSQNWGYYSKEGCNSIDNLGRMIFGSQGAVIDDGIKDYCKNYSTTSSGASDCTFDIKSVSWNDSYNGQKVCQVQVTANLGSIAGGGVGCAAFDNNYKYTYCNFYNYDDATKTYYFKDCDVGSRKGLKAFKFGTCQSIDPNPYVFNPPLSNPSPPPSGWTPKIDNTCTGGSNSCLSQSSNNGGSNGPHFCCEACDISENGEWSRACSVDGNGKNITGSCPSGQAVSFPLQCQKDPEDGNNYKWINKNKTGECNAQCVASNYNPPPSSSTCKLQGACENKRFKDVYMKNGKYYGNSDCTDTAQNNVWDLCGATQCAYYGGTCTSSSVCPAGNKPVSGGSFGCTNICCTGDGTIKNSNPPTTNSAKINVNVSITNGAGKTNANKNMLLGIDFCPTNSGATATIACKSAADSPIAKNTAIPATHTFSNVPKDTSLKYARAYLLPEGNNPPGIWGTPRNSPVGDNESSIDLNLDVSGMSSQLSGTADQGNQAKVKFVIKNKDNLVLNKWSDLAVEWCPNSFNPPDCTTDQETDKQYQGKDDKGNPGQVISNGTTINTTTTKQTTKLNLSAFRGVLMIDVPPNKEFVYSNEKYTSFNSTDTYTLTMDFDNSDSSNIFKKYTSSAKAVADLSNRTGSANSTLALQQALKTAMTTCDASQNCDFVFNKIIDPYRDHLPGPLGLQQILYLGIPSPVLVIEDIGT